MKQSSNALSEGKILLTGIDIFFPITGYVKPKRIGEIRAKVRPADSGIPPVYVEVKLLPEENAIAAAGVVSYDDDTAMSLSSAHMFQNIVYGKIVLAAVQQNHAIKTGGVKQIHIREIHTVDKDGKLDESFMIGRYGSCKENPAGESRVFVYGSNGSGNPARTFERLVQRFEDVKINRTRKVREEIETQEERT